MKKRDSLYLFYVLILSFALSSCNSLDVYSVVNSDINNISINSDIRKTIVKRYWGMENSEFIKDETHTEYANGLVSSITFYDAIPSFEKDKKYTTKKIGDVIFYYDGKKLTKRIDSFYDSDDKLQASQTIYSYSDGESASYETYTENKLESNGKIIIINENQVDIVVNYLNDENKTVTIFKEFDKKGRIIKFREEYFGNGKLKKENYSYQYKNKNLHLVNGPDYEIKYEYVNDNKGNWIKRFEYKNGEVVELLVRELFYK